ncbi:hypothetical protein ACIP6P_12405 [Streptomyces sp. NPDC088729]|uniref:hypothetical protein n=1 Tax=Streptomyces sp. NPDC088729 TaxID=3365876 RepID=UPI0037F85DE1
MTQTPNDSGNTGDTPIRPAGAADSAIGRAPAGSVPPPRNAPAAGSSPAEPARSPGGGPAVPVTSDPRARDARTGAGGAGAEPATPTDGASTRDGRTTAAPAPGSGSADSGAPLFSAEEREKYAARVHQAVAGFVEDPARAVREADATFDEVVSRLSTALADRGRHLRGDRDGERGRAETEDLRIALQHYRDLTERLVHL